MKPTIEHPKVFISYAWGTQEYQDRVLSLARDLQTDGIEVLLDKWNLKEGHDTYAYMEQSVNDPNVTNVLLLLDPVYAKKADDRSGGVGTETQIISPEIYNNVTQEKFIPIVMERSEEGDIPKPHYLRGILHFDLSIAENYDNEYKKLVKRLYGVEVYVRPELGTVPKWVTEETSIPSSKMTALQSLKKYNNPRIARGDFIELLDDLKERIISFDSDTTDYLKLYEEMLPLREEYIQIVKTSHVIDDSMVLLGDFLQEVFSAIDSNMIVLNDIKKCFLHEIFVYTIVLVYKLKDYDALSYFLNRSFFGRNYANVNSDIGYHIFYHNSQQLDIAKGKQDNKNYFSGTAQLWIEHISSNYCNKRELAFADVLLSNYSYFGANNGDNRLWFPITYVYDGENDTILQSISFKLKSREIAQRWARIFGFDDFLQFRDNIKRKNESLGNRRDQRLRYNASFHYVQLFTDFIKPDEIGTLR